VADLLEELREALVGRYQLERELGRGGMATVYLAHDVKHDRKVALKVLHPELAATLGPERFQREIRTTARLQHAHILPVLDSGEAAAQLWYTMPFVRGESLRDRLRRESQLPIDVAIDLTRQVALALDYAHREGVVHRDLKPENILLSDNQALVADFGVAKALSASGEGQLTATGFAVGTPQYMAPEQASGAAVDPRTDVYALGCVLYELLAGEPPYSGPTPHAIMAKRVLEPVPHLRSLRDTVPEAVERTVTKALAKTPADRFQSAAEFAQSLARAAGGELPVMSVSPAPARLNSKSRRTVAVIAAGMTLALFLALFDWLSRPRAPASPDADPLAAEHEKTRIAVLYFADDSPKHALAYLTVGLTEGLIRTLGNVNGLSVVSQGGVAQYRAGNVARDSIARALKVGTLVVGSVEPEQDSIRVSVRVLDDAGIELDRTTFKKPRKALVALANSLSEEAALLIRKRIGKAVQVSRTRASTKNSDAWEKYQRGVLAREQADSLFQAGDSAKSIRAYLKADSFAVMAENLDPRWPDPSVLRAVVSYKRARHAATPTVSDHMIQSGLQHAERALAKDPNNADAMEFRGTLKYWRWLFVPEADPARRDRLLASAQSDLEEATRLNPAQASAYASLAHLYNNAPGKTMVDVTYAARKALEMDTYLSNADVIITRLAYAAYDDGEFAEANKWCREGQRRFPGDTRFIECALRMMLTNFVIPKPEWAWTLADSLVLLAGDSSARRYARLNGRVLVAGVLGRAGLTDSARSLLYNTKDDLTIDPTADLALWAAFVWTLIGDNTAALKQLKAYLDVNPGHRATFRNPNWWFQRLSEDPRYQELVRAPDT
jgi:eukaryotic-like serine/threonine-protein kinase